MEDFGNCFGVDDRHETFEFVDHEKIFEFSGLKENGMKASFGLNDAAGARFDVVAVISRSLKRASRKRMTFVLPEIDKEHDVRIQKLRKGSPFS